jgi:ferritin-like metal-binding protein YciE
MAVKNARELFVLLLSEVRQSTERAGAIFQQMGEAAQIPQVRDALDARAFVAEKTLATLDQVFKIIGEKPSSVDGHLEDILLEDFKKELALIQSPDAKRLFILVKASHLVHIHMGEYAALIATADVTGNYAVGMLLETCLADTAVFVDRSRRLIRQIIETRASLAGAVA